MCIESLAGIRKWDMFEIIGDFREADGFVSIVVSTARSDDRQAEENNQMRLCEVSFWSNRSYYDL